jgi:tetratricopeptide (TPR) repeat protein
MLQIGARTTRSGFTIVWFRKLAAAVAVQASRVHLQSQRKAKGWGLAIRFLTVLSKLQSSSRFEWTQKLCLVLLTRMKRCGFALSLRQGTGVSPSRKHPSTTWFHCAPSSAGLGVCKGLRLENLQSPSQSRTLIRPRFKFIYLLPFALLANLCIAQSGQKSRQDFAALSRGADAARDAEDLSEAALLYQRALALHPAWQEGWWSLGMVQYVKGSFTLCAHAFQRLTVLNPANGTAYVMLGLCEFELDQDAQALRHIEQGETIGIHADAQLANVMRYHHGILLQRLGKFEGAREVLMGLCVDGEQPKPLLNGLGMIALRMPDRHPPPEGSLAADIVARLGLAMSYEAQHKLEQARQIYDEVAQQYPDFPNVHVVYGRFLSEQHDVPAATEEFEQEIKNYPGNVIARLQIASDYYRVDSAAGIPYAKEAVRLAPQYPFGHYVLGLLLVDAGEYRKAVPELETARRTFPHKVPQIYLSLGVAYSHVGRKEEAARAHAMFVQLKKEQEQHAATTEPSGETDQGNITPPQ